MSNVKAGDLAITHSMLIESNNDRLVRVIRLAQPHEHTSIRFGPDSIGWVCEVMGSPMRITRRGIDLGETAQVRPIADKCLRPIRPQSDDAQDESKAWLPPVPFPAIQPELLEQMKTP